MRLHDNGDAGGPETPDSPAVTQITVDTVSPAAPGAPGLDALSDSGINTTDNLTNVTSPSFLVSAGEAGSVHFVVDGKDAGWPVATTPGTGVQSLPLAAQPFSMVQASSYPAGNGNAALGHFTLVVIVSAVGYGLAAVISPPVTRRLTKESWITLLLAWRL